MKKIVIFNPSFEGGGVERNIKLIFKNLNKKLVNKIYFVSYDKINGLDKSIKTIEPFIKLKIKNRLFKYLVCIISILKIYLKHNDLVIFSFQANVYAIIISKILGIKVIVRANSAPTIWTNKFKIFIIKIFYKLADEVIVNSLEFHKEMKKIFNINSKIIYNPIDKEKLINLSKIKKKFNYFDEDKNSLKVINIGRLTVQKNQIELLKTIKKLKEKLPIKLLIIGNGPKKIELENYINMYKLDKNVKILPYTNNPYTYLKKSEIFVLSSLYEGLPNVLIEATLFKLICISFNCKTGPKEILKGGKGGFLVKLNDTKKISYILEKYYFSNKKTKYKKMINISFKNLKLYELNKQTNRYHELMIKFVN